MKILPNGIAVLENDLASRWIEEKNDLVHEPTVRVEICPHLKSGDVVIDAGAYLGSHTKAYLNAVGSTGKVIAFEPNPEAFQCLEINCPAAVLQNQGLSDFTERRVMEEGLPDNYGAATWRRGNGKQLFVPLDSLNLPQINFIKIDVEGMEPNVIRGAIKTLHRCRPILYVELNRRSLALHGTHVRSLVKLIESLDYRIQFMRPEHTLDCEEINVFFFPK